MEEIDRRVGEFMINILEKSKMYDKVKEENELLKNKLEVLSHNYEIAVEECRDMKRKIASLQSANDGYREVLEYKDSIIDKYGRAVGRLCGINYEKRGSAVLSEDLIDVLDVVSTSEAALPIGATFKEIYEENHPYEDYNPNFDIDDLKSAINETSNMIRNNNPYTRFNNGLKPRTYHIFMPGDFQVNDIPYTGEDDEV